MKIHSQAYLYMLILFIIGCISWFFFGGVFSILWFVLFLYVAYFFRQPLYKVDIKENEILSPAWGKVTSVTDVTAEDGTKSIVVSIFLSIFDVHLQCAPCAGIVESVKYEKGAFLNAMKAESSTCNERNLMVIKTAFNGKMIKVTQIAGLIARRILCFKSTGDSLYSGEYYGLIRFGSRVDICFPSDVDIYVKPGERVNGGLTLLGCFR